MSIRISPSTPGHLHASALTLVALAALAVALLALSPIAL